VLVWAVSLARATPLEGVRVRVFSEKNQPLGDGITDGDGLARIELVSSASSEKPAVVVAESASADMPLTWLDLRNTSWNLAGSDVGGRAYLRDGYEAFVYSDRGVYRPGETAHLRAIVRGPNGATP